MLRSQEENIRKKKTLCKIKLAYNLMFIHMMHLQINITKLV